MSAATETPPRTQSTTTAGNDIPVTAILSTFIATTTPASLTPALRAKFKEILVDYIAVVLGGLHNCDSSPKIYHAVLALQGGPLASGRSSPACTVIGKPVREFLPQYAALVNSALGHSLDFDDTFEPGTLHAGVTALSAALTQAEMLEGVAGEEVSWEKVMVAACVGYEVTCRLGRALGYEAYDRGFHNTGTAGVFGAVAVLGSLRGWDIGIVEMALGLAGSRAAGSMQYLDNGSWNKRLHPGFAVHDAFLCASLAEYGVVGATRSIEGKNGFLQAYSPKEDKDLQGLVAGLGEDWTMLTSSLKPYPACRMTHGYIELAGNVHTAFARRKGKALSAEDVDGIVLSMGHSNLLLVGTPSPNKIHPENIVDAQFSAYFQVANALLYGSDTGLEPYNKLDDPEIRALCGKTTVVLDPMAKPGFPADLRITWEDGTREDHFQQYPLGEVQHPFTPEKVEAKFRSLVEPVYGRERASKILQTADGLEQHSIEDLLILLR